MNWKKVRRKLRRWAKKHRDQLLLAGLIAAVLAVALMVPDGSRKDYDDFLDDLGWQESRNDYTVVNRFHYMGRYQMGSLALREIGFMDENGAWTALANSYGIYSEADFLNSPKGQDAAVKAYHKKTCEYIRSLELDAYIGTTYCGVEVTRSGLLAASHLVGIGSLKKGLTTGGHVHDGNHVSAAVYMELFAGYDITQVWQD